MELTESTASILDLPDECLRKIFLYLPAWNVRNKFALTCKRFAAIYCDNYKRELIREGCDLTVFDNNMIRMFAHFIDDDFFPLRNLKTIKLNSIYHVNLFSAKFLNSIRRDHHRSIEVVELTGFTDSDMEYLMPLPNMKSVKLSLSEAAGEHMVGLRKLEELILDSATKFHSEFLLKIVQNNNLRKLVVRGSPLALTPYYVGKIILCMTHLEELECSWCEISLRCGAVGNLPNLKTLIINDFKTTLCTGCKKLDNGELWQPQLPPSPYAICKCGPYDAYPMFMGLYKTNILERLIFIGSRLTQTDILHIGKLRKLKKIYTGMEKVPVFVSLESFCHMKNLEELDIGHSYRPPNEALDLLMYCQNLKFINLGNCRAYSKNFCYKAIDIIKKRRVMPLEPVKIQLFNATISQSFLGQPEIVAASKFVSFEICNRRLPFYSYNPSSIHMCFYND